MSAVRAIAAAALLASSASSDAILSCSAATAPGSPSPADDLPRVGPGAPAPVVLVTIDGARWQEIFEGTDASRLAPPRPRRTAEQLMPTLYALGHQRGAVVGARGAAQIRATGPNFVSLPGYLEILTGRPSTTCTDNECPPTETPTLLDDAAAAGLGVAAFASWERLSHAITARPSAFLVSAGRSPDDTGPPFPGSGAYRPDARTAEAALSHLERERPDVLFLGLGDPDEHAHRGDYDGYLGSLEQADDVLRRLLGVLDRMGERGRATHVFVTADHGRAHDFRSHGGFAPESARVWLVAAGPRVQARGDAASPHERHLADVAPTLSALMALERPRHPGAGEILHELVDGADGVSEPRPSVAQRSSSTTSL